MTTFKSPVVENEAIASVDEDEPLAFLAVECDLGMEPGDLHVWAEVDIDLVFVIFDGAILVVTGGIVLGLVRPSDDNRSLRHVECPILAGNLGKSSCGRVDNGIVVLIDGVHLVACDAKVPNDLVGDVRIRDVPIFITILIVVVDCLVAFDRRAAKGRSSAGFAVGPVETSTLA